MCGFYQKFIELEVGQSMKTNCMHKNSDLYYWKPTEYLAIHFFKSVGCSPVIEMKVSTFP